MKPTRTRLGIVGYGDFTKLLIEHLNPYADIIVHSRRNRPGLVRQAAVFGTAEDVLSADIIIPSIPAQSLQEYFSFHAHYINPRALIIDVCSVKVRPVQVLLSVLPSSVSIVATHPLFGPASTKKGLAGNKIMMHPTRVDENTFNNLVQFCEQLGLKVIQATPEEHDKAMAYAQGLSHYIGRVMQHMEIPDTELSTRAYRDLLDMKTIQGGDSWDLFYSIMHENPYAHDVHTAFKQASQSLDKKLGL